MVRLDCIGRGESVLSHFYHIVYMRLVDLLFIKIRNKLLRSFINDVQIFGEY